MSTLDALPVELFSAELASAFERLDAAVDDEELLVIGFNAYECDELLGAALPVVFSVRPPSPDSSPEAIKSSRLTAAASAAPHAADADRPTVSPPVPAGLFPVWLSGHSDSDLLRLKYLMA